MNTNNVYMLFSDPNKQPIKLKKQLGLWPNLSDAAYGIVPYVKRMSDPVGVVVNCDSGENAIVLLENCPNITKLFCYNIDGKYSGTFNENMKPYQGKFINEKPGNDRKFDFVLLVNMYAREDIKNTLSLYYKRIKPKGIFAMHPFDNFELNIGVKEWRNENHFRLPIETSRNLVWFWRIRP